MLTDGTLRQKPRLPESWFCAVCACTVPGSLFGVGEMRCLTARGALSILLYHSYQEELNPDTTECDATPSDFPDLDTETVKNSEPIPPPRIRQKLTEKEHDNAAIKPPTPLSVSTASCVSSLADLLQASPSRTTTHRPMVSPNSPVTSMERWKLYHHTHQADITSRTTIPGPQATTVRTRHHTRNN